MKTDKLLSDITDLNERQLTVLREVVAELFYTDESGCGQDSEATVSDYAADVVGRLERILEEEK